MAIFTSVANHLKCRNYFESVLGFRLVEKYPDESVADFNEDVEGFVITQGNSTTASVPDVDGYGIFCRRSNRIVAHNIWFLYGKAQPWQTGDDEPPQEIEKGFVIRDNSSTDGNIVNDSCGFVLDSTSDTSGLEFIGMKRMLPLDDITPISGTDKTELDTPDKVSSYKDCVQFLKIKMVDDPQRPGEQKPMPPEKLLNYDSFKPVTEGNNGLNQNQPNSLLLKTAYDYNDFSFDSSGKEYNIRQLGMLTNLHVITNVQTFIRDKETLFNGMTGMPNESQTLGQLFSITENAIVVPDSFVLRDRFTSIVGGIYTYGAIDDDGLRRELGITGNDPNTAVRDENVFFGILQFYINTMPNNRITFQTDTYNFILSFENQIKCNCTCSTCNCVQA